MKKIVRQQNYLKELIDTQSNRFISRQTLKCLVRSALEPLLDNLDEESAVLYRIENKDGLQGLLKRLEFSGIISYCYNDTSDILKENVWANTEFIVVLTHRYVSIIIWDNHTENNDTVRYYSLYNSKLQWETLDIIRRNSNVDISFVEKFNPDRRDNKLLNISLHKLLENMEEASNDAVMGYAENNANVLSDADYAAQKTRVISHEIKNQLSVCDLYAEIIKRQLDKNKIDKEGIKHAINSINKALKITNNLLLSLKTDNVNIAEYNVHEILSEVKELAGIYAEDKDIDFQIEEENEISVYADKEKLTAVLINLVKNAAEAFSPDEEKNGKYIKVKTSKEKNYCSISVSNNAPGIREPEKIFDYGFTTKTNGTGLGLWICKKSVEEQGGELILERSSEDYTEFTIRIKSKEVDI